MKSKMKLMFFSCFAMYFLLCAVLFTGCAITEDAYEEHKEFLRYSLGRHTYVKTEGIEGGSPIPYQRYEWTLSFVDDWGVDCTFKLKNDTSLSSNLETYARSRFYSESKDIIIKYFTESELDFFCIVIPITSVSNHEENSDLIDPENGLVLKSLTPQEYYRFIPYRVILTNSIDFRPEKSYWDTLAPRIEAMIIDLSDYFGNQPEINCELDGVDWENSYVIHYNQEDDSFIWQLKRDVLDKEKYN